MKLFHKEITQLKPVLPLFIALLFLGGVLPAPVSAQVPGEIAALVKSHCVDCHGGDATKGGLDLTALKPDFTARDNFARWEKVFDRVNKGEMPPKKSAQPPAEERAAFVKSLGGGLHAASLAQQKTEGRVALRRINRTQHENTLNDLLGISIHLDDVLPEDGSVAGFDNVSEGLDVSSSHLVLYQQAADVALDAAIATRPAQKLAYRRTGKEMSEERGRFNQLMGKFVRLDGERLNVYIGLPNHISLQSPEIPMTGRYRLKIVAQALNTGDRPLPLEVRVTETIHKPEGRTLATFDAPSDRPGVFELEVVLVKGNGIRINGWQLPGENTVRERLKGKPLDGSYTGPGFAFELMELEGPLGEFPPPSHKQLFGDLPLKPASVVKAELAGKPLPKIPDNRRDDEWRRDPLIPVSKDPRADGQRLIRAFLPRAMRRPVDDATLAYYVGFFQERLDQGYEFHTALRSTYRAILSSANFFYFREQPGALDDYAIASRLSYFLWSSLPDGELTALAAKGELRKPAVLRAQVERMLGDKRSQRFVENFTGQWLELRKINATTPDRNLYREFDGFLFWSMPQETQLFFSEMLQHDRSVAEFVHSDWTMLNSRLAKHYGIDGVNGGELRRVSLPPNAHRGGVMTHASILKLTANGTTTSPILRGKWVLEKIIGTPPAPPPPNVGAIEPDIRGATTVRQQLDKHKALAECASCHKHIDPPGFALESFDVIGGWREFYRVSDHKLAKGHVPVPNYPERKVWRGPNVEIGGTTAEGREFKNVDDYKVLLLEDKEQLARNLARQLLVFATGADVQFADREEVKAIATRTLKQDYGLRSLVHEVVQSRLFLHK
jgi:mono/diheme cytochrome c family protein